MERAWSILLASVGLFIYIQRSFTSTSAVMAAMYAATYIPRKDRTHSHCGYKNRFCPTVPTEVSPIAKEVHSQGIVCQSSVHRLPSAESYPAGCTVPVLKLPMLRWRPKLLYDRTQLSANPCVPRPKLQGLDGKSSAQQSGPWSGIGLVRGQLGLKSLIIGVFDALESDHKRFERNWVWSELHLRALESDHKRFERNWVWSGTISSALFFSFYVFLERCGLCQEATIKQRSDQRLILSPIAVTRK